MFIGIPLEYSCTLTLIYHYQIWILFFMFLVNNTYYLFHIQLPKYLYPQDIDVIIVLRGTTC